MKVYRRDTGDTYTPFNHFDMNTQVIFNPETGSKHANVTLSTNPKGAGRDDETHNHSDQIFYIIKEEMKTVNCSRCSRGGRFLGVGRRCPCRDQRPERHHSPPAD